ncbi:hypothetical protein IP84_08650 [beta proteobacterium AAP99]|nr:hypothetical protein IP84_08650 [beta proteobacterium AAP99]
MIVVRDKDSSEAYKRYYRLISEIRLYVPQLQLYLMPCGAAAVFLASSFPTVDQEIAFARALRERLSVPLIVKLHPAHLYDKRGLELKGLADYEAHRDASPACAVFVSHSSSMELLYRSHGIRTVALSQHASTAAAVEEVSQAMSAYNLFNKTPPL